MTGRERIEAVLQGQKPDAVPLMAITMMYAADHVGVPYRSYATDHRVLAEAQVQTAEHYGFDHVSVISDPAREAADCGASVVYFDDQPPAIDESHALLADKSTLLNLSPPDPLGGGRMTDRVQGVALLKEKAGQEKYIEGWVEGPCAEGADLRGINTLMMDFYDDPDLVRDLFTFNVAMALEFAQAQVEAGADIIGLGDAAASLIGPQLYEEFVLPYEKELVSGIQALGARVRLHICGNTTPIFSGIGSLGCDIVDLDSMVSIQEARAAMGPNQVLLGNMDPVSVIKNGTLDSIKAAVESCHTEAGEAYIIGAGCEIPRGTPIENVMALQAYAQSH